MKTNEQKDCINEKNIDINSLVRELEEIKTELADYKNTQMQFEVMIQTLTETIEEQHEILVQHDVLVNSVMNDNKTTLEALLHTVNDLHFVLGNTKEYKKALKLIKKSEKKNEKIIVKIYRYLKAGRKRSKLINIIKAVVGKVSPRLKNRIAYELWEEKMGDIESRPILDNDYDWLMEMEEEKEINNPLVSVIVPNYNHAPYLKERLDSIYNQTYENIEVILLDDCSTDNSREILLEYAEKYSDKTIVAFNEKNVGKVNLQWNKGLALAKGEYIWIAESDDWCELDFLEKLVPKMNYQSVMIAFARSVFMTDGVKTWSTEEYLHDTDIDWTKSFDMTSSEAIQKGFAKKNIIPNVSSAIFRNVKQLPEEVMDIWKNIKLCGDWIFYLYMLKGGTFSYVVETTNYYRIHRGSTSLKVQKTDEYYREQETVSRYISKNYNVDVHVFEDVLQDLKKHYLNILKTLDLERKLVLT